MHANSHIVHRARSSRFQTRLVGLAVLPLAILFPTIAVASLNALCGFECFRFRAAPRWRYVAAGSILCLLSATQLAVCFTVLSPLVPWTPFDW